jgi:hypothetical protein
MIKDTKLRQRIEEVLVALTHCRDDDHRLIANIWQKELLEQMGLDKYKSLTAQELLGIYAKHKLSSPESIRRMRQKIQEIQPLMRGSKYQDRQRYQGEVKKEIRAFT